LWCCGQWRALNLADVRCTLPAGGAVFWPRPGPKSPVAGISGEGAARPRGTYTDQAAQVSPMGSQGVFTTTQFRIAWNHATRYGKHVCGLPVTSALTRRHRLRLRRETQPRVSRYDHRWAALRTHARNVGGATGAAAAAAALSSYPRPCTDGAAPRPVRRECVRPSAWLLA
jgi:hypothetical protein